MAMTTCRLKVPLTLNIRVRDDGDEAAVDRAQSVLAKCLELLAPLDLDPDGGWDDALEETVHVVAQPGLLDITRDDDEDDDQPRARRIAASPNAARRAVTRPPAWPAGTRPRGRGSSAAL